MELDADCRDINKRNRENAEILKWWYQASALAKAASRHSRHLVNGEEHTSSHLRAQSWLSQWMQCTSSLQFIIGACTINGSVEMLQEYHFQITEWLPTSRGCIMGVNATGTLGGSQVERRRRENRSAVYERRGGWGLGSGCAPSQKIYEFFVSKWRDMVHSGCVVFKIHVSHGL